jgi:hypothetical protein
MSRLGHLAGRFLGVLGARPLTPAEQRQVAGLLRPDERPLFWRQSPADQRHGYECACRVLSRAPARRDLVRAALLHDVGKGAARVRVPGRVLAAVLSGLHLPAPGELEDYLAHGPRGAEALRAAGAEPLVASYAQHHHGKPPPEVAADDWHLLAAADHG